MRTVKLILTLGLTLALFACKNDQTPGMQSEASESAPSPKDFISSTAAVENNLDSTRRFIRTADLKFKVKSVLQSTYDIEFIMARQGGFVTYTNLNSSIDYTTTTAVSADSSLETTYFTVSNSMILRVLNTLLDTTLKEISRNIDYLDYRIIKADDVALQIRSNELTQKRSAKNEARLEKAIENRGKKLNETTTAEEVLLSKQEQADNAKIANLALTDQINFSTINISIYQRQAIKRELVSNRKDIAAYDPGFGSKLLESVAYGWRMLEALVVFLVQLWAVLLFLLLAYFLYKKYNSRQKKVGSEK